jgi:hypothetical protein
MENATKVPNEKRRVFLGLFVFPMLIAVTMAVLLSSIVLLTREEITPESLITAIKTGSSSKRWQKAYELSNELNREGGLLRSQGIMNEVIHILNDKIRYDARTRAYMAMALSRFSSAEAETALLQALKQAEPTDDPQVALFIMWGLGNIGRQDPARAELVDEVSKFLRSEQADLRKTASYVLGVFGDKRAVELLQVALDDAVIDVRWNAALGLSRLGDDSGRDILLEMLDRAHLVRAGELSNSQLEHIMTNAAKGLQLIAASLDETDGTFKNDAKNILTEVSTNDSSLKVREAALQALKYFQ